VLQQSRFDEVETRLEKMHKAEYPGGVVVDPLPVTAGEEVAVFYNGLKYTFITGTAGMTGGIIFRTSGCRKQVGDG